MANLDEWEKIKYDKEHLKLRNKGTWEFTHIPRTKYALFTGASEEFISRMKGKDPYDGLTSASIFWKKDQCDEAKKLRFSLSRLHKIMPWDLPVRISYRRDPTQYVFRKKSFDSRMDSLKATARIIQRSLATIVPWGTKSFHLDRFLEFVPEYRPLILNRDPDMEYEASLNSEINATVRRGAPELRIIVADKNEAAAFMNSNCRIRGESDYNSYSLDNLDAYLLVPTFTGWGQGILPTRLDRDIPHKHG